MLPVRGGRVERLEAALSMQALENKRVLVVGLGASGRAASDLLRKRGAKVLAIDSAATAQLRREADALRTSGVEVRLGVKEPPGDALDLAVISPGEIGRAHV